MAYLVASSIKNDLSIVRESPELWRHVRRYNLPVQLALAAVEDIVAAATDPSTAGIVSLAPCQPGSTELFRWSEVIVERVRCGALGDTRMNPTDRKSTRLNSSHLGISYAVFCLKKKTK